MSKRESLGAVYRAQQTPGRERLAPGFAEILLAAEPRTQRLRNADAPVGLLVILDQRNDGAGRGQRCVVQRVYIAHDAIFAAIANVGATGLIVVEVRI